MTLFEEIRDNAGKIMITGGILVIIGSFLLLLFEIYVYFWFLVNNPDIEVKLISCVVLGFIILIWGVGMIVMAIGFILSRKK